MANVLYPEFADTYPTQPAPLDTRERIAVLSKQNNIAPRLLRRPYIADGIDQQGHLRPGRVVLTSEPRRITMGAWLVGLGIVALAVLVFAGIGAGAVFGALR